jgi:hypothetical protein
MMSAIEVSNHHPYESARPNAMTKDLMSATRRSSRRTK